MNDWLEAAKMKASAREKLKARRPNGYFMRFPSEVLDSPKFLALSFKAKALLLDLGSQFRGFNNGDLAMPWSMMKLRGWKSKDTLHNAQKELIEAGMIELTRQGGLHCASLFAFTWMPIEECAGKLDVRATRVPSAKWRE